MQATLPLCEVLDCGQLATTTLSGDPYLLRNLGFQMGTERFMVRVCAGCYLRAMGEIMARAKVPKELPPKVEYACATCGKVMSPMEVRFHNGASPYHILPGLAGAPGRPEQKHALTVKVLR